MMKDQNEIYEAATETPIGEVKVEGEGEQRNFPLAHIPSGADGTEPGAQGGEGVPPSRIEELKKQGSKLKACNDRSYAKMVRIAELANECVLRTTHAEYAPGQYGQDYREFGKTMCEIRELVGPVLAERFAAKEVDDKAAKTAEFFRNHFSLGNGLFPIRRANCEKAVTEHCWISGRRFTLELSQDIHDDGAHVCCAKIRDNGEEVAKVVVRRGKAMAERVAHGAFVSYIRNLSGSSKHSSRGGFLKQAAKRAVDAQKRAAALSPAAELAATVARQQGDDDLAQQLENA